MKRLFLTVVLALTMLLSALPAQAAGVNTSHFSFKGQSGEAFFESVDPSGCVSTSAYLFVTDGRNKYDAVPPTPNSQIYLWVSRYDSCSGENIWAESYSVPAPDAFQYHPQLKSATLNTTVVVYDSETSNPFEVQISVSWLGTGDLSHDKQQIRHYGVPPYNTTIRWSGAFRDAAVTGSITYGLINFTPEPAVSADLQLARFGDVTISP